MKKRWLTLLVALASNPLLLFANDSSFLDAVLFQYINYKASCGSCQARLPFGVLATGDAIGKASQQNGNHNIDFSEAEANALFGFKTGLESGITLEAGYGNNLVKLSNNPSFNQTSFNYAQAAVLGYTGEVCDWFWQAGLGVHINNDFNSDWLQYSRWSAFLWGRYAFNRNFGFHVGTLTMTGLRKTVTFPILGFDWTFSRKWELNAIFPVYMRLNYLMTSNWTLGAGLRPFLVRQRVGVQETLTRAIFEYRNWGGELNLCYNYKSLFATAFGGYAFSARYKVMDQNGDFPTYYYFNSSPYAGINFLFAF